MANWKNIRMIDIVNPKKWWAFIIGKLLNKYVGLEYCEQVVYRSIMCKPCVEAGSCTGCGCTMPDAIMAPNNWCSEGKWQPMMDKERWQNYKEDTGFQFNISIDLSKNKKN